MPDAPPLPALLRLFLGFQSVGMYGFGGVLPWARLIVVAQKRWLAAADFTGMLRRRGPAFPRKMAEQSLYGSGSPIGAHRRPHNPARQAKIGENAMANPNDTMSCDRQQSKGVLDLIAPAILAFIDLRNADGRSNHSLRWAVAVAAVFVAGQLMFGGAAMAARTQVITVEATSSTTL